MNVIRSCTIGLVAAALAATSASAQIVDNPSTIHVSANGTYITDTANHLDWYRFSNAVNTIGLSYADVSLSSSFAGWSIASLSQVQSLQTQFGWQADTPNAALNNNYGLTYAMGQYLGLTGVYYVGGFTPSDEMDIIQAMTSETYYTGPNLDIQNQGVTTSRTFSYALRGGTFYYGDYVDGGYAFQDFQATDVGTGTWLTRASVDDCNGGVRTAPTCDVTTTPEPASLVLLGTGLLFVGGVAGRRRKALNA